MLNFIWITFLVGGFICAAVQAIFAGQWSIWSVMSEAVFSSAKNAFSLSINLTGMLCWWLGLLKIAETSGLSEWAAKGLQPLMRKVMPDVPASSPAMGSIVMNMAANILGLDNAATPMGLRAMEHLQELNPHKDKASNAQVLFMVINSSAVTLIPITILMYRAEMGSSSPSAVFVPILLATSCSTLVGFFSVAFVQKLPIFNKIVLSYLLVFGSIIGGVAWGFYALPPEERLRVSASGGNFVLMAFMMLFVLSGVVKKQNVYEVFIKGAKEGFETAVRIIPYLIAMLVAISVFRSSGALDYIISGIAWIFEKAEWNTEFVGALPTAFMKPLSGSGARAMMLETFDQYGADSFQSFVSSVIQGSTETTFYVLAVYFGAVKISKVGAAVPCALLADFAGISAAIILSYWFY